MPRPATGLNVVSRKRPDGSVDQVWYHRRTGLLIGRSRDGWTKEAAVARGLEMDGEAPAGPPAGSFGALCALYLGSPAYKNKAKKTRGEYADHIEVLRAAWESVPIGGITRLAVRTLHQTYEDRPWQANAIIRTLRLVMNFGLREVEFPGLVANPAAHVTLYETRPRTQIWDQPRIDAFLAAASPRLRLAFALLLYTVQRPSDMLAMERPAMVERDGRTWIRLRQTKRHALVDVPCHHRLLAEIKAVPAAPAVLATKGQTAPVPRILTNAKGRAWSYRRFAQAWDRTRRAANWSITRAAIHAMGGLPRVPAERKAAKEAIRARLLTDLQRRDLRRTGVVQQAIAGATIPQIAALTGWSIDRTQTIVDTYLPRRGEVALGGVEKWEQDGARVVVLAARRH